MRVYLDGRKVRHLREEMWLSRAEACELSGVGYSTWRNVEINKGAVRSTTARKMARILQIEPKSLAGRKEGLHLVGETAVGED